MWEGWASKNRCFWIMVLEKTLERHLDCKEIQSVYPNGNRSWIVIGRTDAEAETLILWSPDAKNWLTGKEPDAGKDWRQEEKGMTEDEMVGWYHWLNGHELEQLWELVMDREPGVLQSMGSQSQTQLSNWTTTWHSQDRQDSSEFLWVWVLASALDKQNTPCRLLCSGWLWLMFQLSRSRGL